MGSILEPNLSRSLSEKVCGIKNVVALSALGQAANDPKSLEIQGRM